jgi:hypothetical protein
MKHLSPATLLDAVESAAQLPAEEARHLRECGACRAEVDALRAVVARAAADHAPEPPALFWDHFAARVSAAVRTGSPSPESASWFGRLPRPLTTWAAVAAAALLIVSAIWRVTLQAPTPVGPRPQVTVTTAAGDPAATALAASPADNVDADERWAVVRIAAEDLAWDDAHDAGIGARPGDAEGVALELTADERSELVRLLDRELKRNGV